MLEFSLKFIEELDKNVREMEMMDSICDLNARKHLQNNLKMLIEF